MVAAAVAVLALIGGLIVAGTRADDDPVPADQPEPPADIDPVPDDELEPVPEPDTDDTLVEESVVEVDPAVLIPQFVLSSRIDSSGEVLNAPEVVRGADVLGCSELSYVDSGAGGTTDRVYSCESGEYSGTFTVRFRPQGLANADFLSRWVIVGATGDFVGLQGDGVFFVDIDDVDDAAGENLVGTIQYVADGELAAEADPTALLPQFVMSSRINQSGDVLEDPAVERGADELGCSALSYVDSGAGSTTTRVFTCESGERAGSFAVQFRPQGFTNADFLGLWVVVGATGDFVGLQGGGVFFLDIHDVDNDAGENFVGQIEYVSADAAG
jgi:hypothetical protein